MLKGRNMFCQYFFLTIMITFSPSTYTQIKFESMATDLGIDYSTGSTNMGNGVSFYDFDNDGWDDLTFASEDGKNIKFFKNKNGIFSSVSLNITSVNYETRQVNWVDIDNDGDKDLFITSNTNRNILFENTGTLNFKEITTSAGLPTDNLFTYGASWGDYNNDGFLDVFIANRDINLLTQTPNYLFKNNGNNTFTDVSLSAGIDRLEHLSFCSAFFDFNNDGLQDIYISNDKAISPNQLYKNNGDNTFTEVGSLTGTNLKINAMTVTIGDFNNDGWFDIYVTDLLKSILFRNNGDETFTDVALSSGTKFNSVGWGSVFLDADNDKDLDLYVSGSYFNDPNFASSSFYENLNDGTFVIPSDAGFANDQGYSHSNAIGDINNDGLPDFVVTNTNNQNVVVWQNKNTENNHWLKVDLEGTVSNKDGIGSLIEISINGKKQFRYTHCGEGYLSQNSSTEFFGLGTSTLIDYVKVKWLSGKEDVFNDVTSNQKIHIVEGTALLSIPKSENIIVSASPNPVIDNLFIRSKIPVNNIRIYNILQQLVYSNTDFIFDESIKFSAFESGVYFLNFMIENQSKTLKIIKK